MREINLKFKNGNTRKFKTENSGLLKFCDEGYGIGSVEYIKDEKKDRSENKYSDIKDIFIPTIDNKDDWSSNSIFFDTDSGNVHLIPMCTSIAKKISDDNNTFKDKIQKEGKKYSFENGDVIKLSKSGAPRIFNESKYKNIESQINTNQLFAFIKFMYNDIVYQMIPFRFSRDMDNYVSCKYYSIQFIRINKGESINYYATSLEDSSKTLQYEELNAGIHYFNPDVKFYNSESELNTEEIVEQFIRFINLGEGDIIQFKN